MPTSRHSASPAPWKSSLVLPSGAPVGAGSMMETQPAPYLSLIVYPGAPAAMTRRFSLWCRTPATDSPRREPDWSTFHQEEGALEIG